MKDDWDRVQAFISGAQLHKVNGIEGFPTTRRLDNFMQVKGESTEKVKSDGTEVRALPT